MLCCGYSLQYANDLIHSVIWFCFARLGDLKTDGNRKEMRLWFLTRERRF